MAHLPARGLLLQPAQEQVSRVADGLAEPQVGDLLLFGQRPERSLRNTQSAGSVAWSQRQRNIVRRWWRRVN
jgi:hypothetical protein